MTRPRVAAPSSCARICHSFSLRAGIASSDLLKSHPGQLYLGTDDFDAIETWRATTPYLLALQFCAFANRVAMEKSNHIVAAPRQRRRSASGKRASTPTQASATVA